jgi:hypothetical protein
MVTIKEISKNDKDLFIIDYSNCKQDEMINGVVELTGKILEKNKPTMILSVFNERAYVTPGFMRTAEKANIELSHLLDKQAVVGLSPVKKMILKGFNILLRKNIRSFNTVDEAMEFLFDATTTDRDFEE